MHLRRKHGNHSSEKFPQICDLCEKTIKSSKEMKKHMKTHSYTGDFFPDLDRGWYKCELCDFTSKTVETMEVHVGKCQTEDFECGLCEFSTNSLENLELHLKSCEIYEC